MRSFFFRSTRRLKFYVHFKTSAETKFNDFLKCRDASFFYIVLNFRNVGFSGPNFFCKLFLCHSHFNTSVVNQSANFKCIITRFKFVTRVGPTFAVVFFFELF